jgi:hypothetical protein
MATIQKKMAEIRELDMVGGLSTTTSEAWTWSTYNNQTVIDGVTTVTSSD